MGQGEEAARASVYGMSLFIRRGSPEARPDCCKGMDEPAPVGHKG
jgi:hypothetical protein